MLDTKLFSFKIFTLRKKGFQFAFSVFCAVIFRVLTNVVQYRFRRDFIQIIMDNILTQYKYFEFLDTRNCNPEDSCSVGENCSF